MSFKKSVFISHKDERCQKKKKNIQNEYITGYIIIIVFHKYQ